MPGLSAEQRRFLLYLASLGVLVLAGYRESVLGLPLADLCALTARAAFNTLQILGVPAVLSGTTISHPSGLALEIYFGCTGFLPAVCLSVAIWASPGAAQRKLMGIGVGVPILLALNLLRVVHLYVIGMTRPELFDFLHGVVWQATIGAAVIGMWWLWLSAPSGRKSERGRVAPTIDRA